MKLTGETGDRGFFNLVLNPLMLVRGLPKKEGDAPYDAWNFRNELKAEISDDLHAALFDFIGGGAAVKLTPIATLAFWGKATLHLVRAGVEGTVLGVSALRSAVRDRRTSA